MNTAFINGEYVDLANAKVSIFDRGFLFGDAVYEVLPVYNGQPYFVDRHLARLYANLQKIKIDIPKLNWNDLFSRLIQENNGGDLQIYIQITRGNQGIRTHDIPNALIPSIIAFTIHNKFPTGSEKEKGLRAKTVEDIRWQRCDIKTTSLLPNILLNDEAVASGFQTSILVRDNIIMEGSTSNVFIVDENETVKTPPLNHFCLPGITRQIAIELIKKLKWRFFEEEIKVDELFAAKEIWITSTTKEIFPVTSINNSPINNGRCGDYWRTIEQYYRELIS